MENLKRSTLKSLSEMFAISPCELMCFEENKISNTQSCQWNNKNSDNEQLAKEAYLMEQIHYQYGKDAVKLLEFFTQLNNVGQEKAFENISDLAALEKYTKSKKTKNA